jgi:oligoendopeptidase F
MSANTIPTRHFVPAVFDPSDWTAIEPLMRALLDRPLASAADLEKWLLDYSELASVLDEYRARRYIDMSCHTDDAEIEKRYMHYVQEIEPKVKPLDFALKKRLVDSPHRQQLRAPKYDLLQKHWKADVDIFRQINVPLETELIRLTTEYDKITGAMTVEFEGQQCTMPKLAKFLEEPDRNLRQRAWMEFTDRRLQDSDRIEDLFDQMLPLRNELAANAGFANYRQFIWVEKRRFDYTPQDCLQFSSAIEQCCVPVMRKLDQQRAQMLGLDKLRPWDLAVDPKNRPPLKPFAEGDTDRLVARTKSIFDMLSPALGEQFDSLRINRNLDLDSRKGKAPGGYQESLNESRQPFIFMNATGTQRDVKTLLHEGGHAFHAIASANEPLMFLRHAPMEFCEVASMAMELLGSEHFDVFYDSQEQARARRKQLEGIVTLLPWIATIDSFQHWIYTHPGHSRQQRAAEWLALSDRFASVLDWTGHERARSASWQAQLHLFHVPFYYVEYGIAQLGALQLWLKAKSDPAAALSNYRAALALGGTRSLPELFTAAGIHFDFSIRTLEPLMNAVENELDRLPM